MNINCIFLLAIAYKFLDKINVDRKRKENTTWNKRTYEDEKILM